MLGLRVEKGLDPTLPEPTKAYCGGAGMLGPRTLLPAGCSAASAPSDLGFGM